MKKVILMGSLMVLSGLPNIYASDSSLATIGSTQLSAVNSGATGTIAVTSATENTEIARIPSYQYANSFEFKDIKQEICSEEKAQLRKRILAKEPF